MSGLLENQIFLGETRIAESTRSCSFSKILLKLIQQSATTIQQSAKFCCKQKILTNVLTLHTSYFRIDH
jgi:hypothetical protein